MSLEDKYPAYFLTLWAVYPQWPLGRSVKKLAGDKFRIANKACGFMDSDIEQIKLDILDRIHNCDTWQKGNKYGPPAMQKYFHQRMWNEPYQKTVRRREYQPEETEVPRTHEDIAAADRAFEIAMRQLH